MIQVRYSTSPSSVETARAADLRENFLVDDLFETGEVHAVYTHDDRMVVGGAVPGHERLDLPAWTEVLGVDVAPGAPRARHHQRRARPGTSSSTARSSSSATSTGCTSVAAARSSFTGADAAFYFVSAPADATYPTTAAQSTTRSSRWRIGTAQGASERELFRYAWGADLKTATLQFGVTVLADGSVWNTMPPHLHDRRTEVYLYVDLADDDQGLPLPRQARRHPAPGGAATGRPSSRRRGPSTPAPAPSSYAFIWAMAGENTTYTDLAPVPLEEL